MFDFKNKYWNIIIKIILTIVDKIMVKRLSIFKKFDDSKNDKRMKNNKTIGPE